MYEGGKQTELKLPYRLPRISLTWGKMDFDFFIAFGQSDPPCVGGGQKLIFSQEEVGPVLLRCVLAL